MAEELGHARANRIAAGTGEHAGSVAGPRSSRSARLISPPVYGECRANATRGPRSSKRRQEMKSIRQAVASLAMPVLLTMAAFPAHAADAVANFYRGKTVQVLVGFGPGGGYDL